MKSHYLIIWVGVTWQMARVAYSKTVGSKVADNKWLTTSNEWREINARKRAMGCRWCETDCGRLAAEGVWRMVVTNDRW